MEIDRDSLPTETAGEETAKGSPHDYLRRVFQYHFYSLLPGDAGGGVRNDLTGKITNRKL